MVAVDDGIQAIKPRAAGFDAEVAATLRRERKARRLTLAEVAEVAKTTPQTIQRLETNGMRLSTEWIEKYCAALGINPRSLMGERVSLNRRLVMSVIAGVDAQIDEMRQLRKHLQDLLNEEGPLWLKTRS
jgi:transcriptional regulator with XRE-family HTH domain